MARKRTRWNEKQARRLLIEAEESGLSLEEFSRRRGFQPRRLREWQLKLEKTAAANPPQFVELVPDQVARPAVARVTCPTGHVVELHDVDPMRVLAVALGAAPAVPSC